MKKASSQEEERVSERWGTGVELRAVGPRKGQRKATSEVIQPTYREEEVGGRSGRWCSL